MAVALSSESPATAGSDEVMVDDHEFTSTNRPLDCKGSVSDEVESECGDAESQPKGPRQDERHAKTKGVDSYVTVTNCPPVDETNRPSAEVPPRPRFTRDRERNCDQQNPVSNSAAGREIPLLSSDASPRNPLSLPQEESGRNSQTQSRTW